MRHVDIEERRRRLVARHHLAAPAVSVEQVAGALVGLHSSDPATVMLSLRARLRSFSVADAEAALYDRRSVVRMLAMRRTMFVVPLELADVMLASCTRALVPGERRKLVALLEGAGVVDVERWIARVSVATLDVLREHGPQPASKLTKLVPELALRFDMAVGKKYEGTIGASTRLLFLLATEGRIVRGRPLGSWLSSQYRWARAEDWIAPRPELLPAAARAELVRRWLRAYGPGTLTDLAWWTKWAKADVRAALAAVGAVEVTVDGDCDAPVPAWILADDVDQTPPETALRDGRPPVSLLPGLDSTMMGWKERGWYLGPHAGPMFDRNGNAGPTIWVGGCAVGVWSQRADGQVVTALLEPLDDETTIRIAAAAAEATAWFDGVRVTPRFPTPLGRQLAAST
ncbi:MAG: winged helix DNA-binding domain-containing protein [Acidimicrobiia bacterium]|nr:winged helix DNA-binding domain-containing protein [Acidimicrobiia bacterium]